jgi:predicted enzyme related to lactoylglutathione lyase
MGRGAIIEDPHGAALGLFTAAPGATDGVNPHGHGFMCWSELVTPDPKASAEFLAHVLGWTAAEKDMGDFSVTIASACGHPVASLWKRPADDPHPWKRARWYPYVQVDAIDPAAARARALGAMLPCDIMPIPGVGRWQPTIDPTGCETALLEPARREPTG